MQQGMHSNKSKNSCCHIIEHNSGAVGKSLQLPHWRRLHDVEHSKKYKARKKTFPCERDRDQGDELARDLVDDDELRIFSYGGMCYASSGGDADQRDQHRESYGHWSL